MIIQQRAARILLELVGESKSTTTIWQTTRSKDENHETHASALTSSLKDDDHTVVRTIRELADANAKHDVRHNGTTKENNPPPTTRHDT